MDKKVFSIFSEINSIEFNFKKFRPFFINFTKKETYPNPFQGVNYNIESFNNYQKAFKRLEVERFISRTRDKSLTPYGEVTVNENFKYELFGIKKDIYIKFDTKIFGQLNKTVFSSISYQDFFGLKTPGN